MKACIIGDNLMLDIQSESHRKSDMVDDTFDDRKVTQMACLFIKILGGSIDYLKLMKLLYIADKEALSSLGNSISGDAFYSMPLGPVLSKTLDMSGKYYEKTNKAYWRKHITAQSCNHELTQKEEPGNGDLSEAETDIIKKVIAELGMKTGKQLVDITHAFSEYNEPHGSSIPIEIIDMLLDKKLSKESAQAIVDDINSYNEYRKLFRE